MRDGVEIPLDDEGRQEQGTDFSTGAAGAAPEYDEALASSARPGVGTSEVLIVDGAIQGFDLLVNGLARPMPVVQLLRGRSPLGQIAHAMAGLRGIDRLHIVAHGGPGLLSLAGYRFDRHAFGNEDEMRALEAIRDSLRADACIALWACGVAEGQEGRDFIGMLEKRFKRQIAASRRPMGAGREWVLDRGPRVWPPICEAAALDYPYVL